jgi:hypothetical protein
VLTRRVKVQNYSRSARLYAISNEFRYANDATGAVQLIMPKNVFVPAHGSETFDVFMRIDPSKLPDWILNGGSGGGTGALLQTAEFDGYIKLKDSRDDIHLAWQVLPHKSADVHALDRSVTINGNQPGTLGLANFSRASGGDFDIFALTGTSPRIPRKDLPADGDDFAVTDIASVGVRLVAGAYLQFAVNTYGRRAHPAYPAEFDVDIDTNGDGNPDYVVFTQENGAAAGAGATGQTLVFVANLATASATAFFYADADLDSGNVILTAPLAALGGIAPTQQIKFNVTVFDNYFTGEPTDSVAGMVFTPAIPKFTTTIDTGTVTPFNSGLISVDDVNGGATASPSQSGLLLLYRDARIEAETVSVKVKPKKN